MENLFLTVAAEEADCLARDLEENGFRPTPVRSSRFRGGSLAEVVELVIRNLEPERLGTLLLVLKLLIDRKRVKRLVLRVGDREVQLEGAYPDALKETLGSILSVLTPEGAANMTSEGASENEPLKDSCEALPDDALQAPLPPKS